MSHQPPKHNEDILAFQAAELQERCKFVEGFNPAQVGISAVLANDLGDIQQTRQRFFLEQSKDFRQPLPYLLFTRKDVLGQKTYLTYQRTPLGGESRLFKDHSIGPGGHVDGGDVQRRDGVFDYSSTVRENMVREATEELKWFIDADSVFDFVDTETLVRGLVERATLLGWLYDNSNDVGQHHLGIVYEIELPAGVYAEIKETQNIFKGYKTLEQLKAEVAGGVSYESWTRLLIEALA